MLSPVQIMFDKIWTMTNIQSNIVKHFVHLEGDQLKLA